MVGNDKNYSTVTLHKMSLYQITLSLDGRGKARVRVT